MTLRKPSFTVAAATLVLAVTLAAGSLTAQQRAVPRGSAGGGHAVSGPGPSVAVGRAVPRPLPPPGQYPPSHGSAVVVAGYPGFYPWGYGGFGFGTYWGPYNPWQFSVSVGFGYGYPAYAHPYGYGWGPYPGPAYAAYVCCSNPYGSVRLKGNVKHAEVFVDGYYAGTVEDFDGTFQRLHVEPGSHTIEIKADGYEPLSVNVRALPDRTINYQADLKKF